MRGVDRIKENFREKGDIGHERKSKNREKRGKESLREKQERM